MNTLIILGHKTRDSFGAALAQAYAEGVREGGAQAQVLPLGSLNFDPVADPRTVEALETDLQEAQRAIEAADHLVFVYPVWWGAAPALLKAFVDRTFLTGWAYRYEKGKALPEGLLKGRTARIVITMDSPRWWNRLIYRNAAVNWLKWATLWFCGIKTVGVDELAGVRTSEAARREGWLASIRARGAQDAKLRGRLVRETRIV